jgi:hypothetical protein
MAGSRFAHRSKEGTKMARIVAILFALTLSSGLYGAAAHADLAGSPETVSLDIKDADLQNALVALARAAGVSIVVPSGVEGNVTCHLEGLPIESALTVLLEPFDLTYRVVRGGVYVVTRKGEQVQPTPPVRPPEEDKARESNILVEKIPLKYADPYWIYAFLSGDETRRSLGIGSLSIIPNPWENSLLGRFGAGNLGTFPPYEDGGPWQGPDEPAAGPLGPGTGPGSGGGGGGSQ